MDVTHYIKHLKRMVLLTDCRMPDLDDIKFGLRFLADSNDEYVEDEMIEDLANEVLTEVKKILN